MSWSILVADDDPMIRNLLRIMLETDNHTVYEAQNGQDAVEKARKIHPDAMILNIRMPGMDGFTLSVDGCVGLCRMSVSRRKSI